MEDRPDAFKSGISEGALMQLVSEQTERASVGERDALRLDVLFVHEDLLDAPSKCAITGAFNLEPKGTSS